VGPNDVADFYRLIEATRLPNLKAQSPSQRSDGDCALQTGLINRFVKLMRPQNATRYYGTVAATDWAPLVPMDASPNSGD
jgi:hypothetical protein